MDLLYPCRFLFLMDLNPSILFLTLPFAWYLIFLVEIRLQWHTMASFCKASNHCYASSTGWRPRTGSRPSILLGSSSRCGPDKGRRSKAGRNAYSDLGMGRVDMQPVGGSSEMVARTRLPHFHHHVLQQDDWETALWHQGIFAYWSRCPDPCLLKQWHIFAAVSLSRSWTIMALGRCYRGLSTGCKYQSYTHEASGQWMHSSTLCLSP